MSSKAFVIFAIQAVLLQTAFASCINRLPIGCTETILPNQLLLPQQQIIPQVSTVVQDNTVANNLANALQLLVVSNLLSNTLPVPEYGPVEVVQSLPYGVEVINGLPLSNYALSNCGCGLSGCGCNAPLLSSCGCGVTGCGCNAPILSSCGCGAPLTSSCGCGSPMVSDCGCGSPVVSCSGCTEIYNLGPISAPGYSYLY